MAKATWSRRVQVGALAFGGGMGGIQWGSVPPPPPSVTPPPPTSVPSAVSTLSDDLLKYYQNVTRAVLGDDPHLMKVNNLGGGWGLGQKIYGEGDPHNPHSLPHPIGGSSGPADQP